MSAPTGPTAAAPPTGNAQPASGSAGGNSSAAANSSNSTLRLASRFTGFAARLDDIDEWGNWRLLRLANCQIFLFLSQVGKISVKIVFLP